MKSINSTHIEAAEVKITRYPFLGGRIPQLGYNTFIAVNPVELIELWSNNGVDFIIPDTDYDKVIMAHDKDYDGNIHSETKFLR